MLRFQLLWNTVTFSSKACANYCSMQSLSNMRMTLTHHLQKIYMDRRGRSYYCISQLDRKVDDGESRISNDVELFCQFAFEFVFGGILSPESGMILQLVSGAVVFFTSYKQVLKRTQHHSLAAVAVGVPR